MKQHLLISLLIVLLFVLAPHALADTAQKSGFVALAPIPGLTSPEATSVLNSTSLANFFNNLYKYLIGLAAVIAIIEIIWGGLQISTTESVGNITEGKKRIYQAIWGLVLILSPVVVFSLINPNILNLSLSLPELDTKMGAPTSGDTTLPPCVAGNTAGAGKTCTLVAKNEGTTVNTLPTCGPSVTGSCTNDTPACTPGQYCYLTTDKNNIAGVVCSTLKKDCDYLFTQQNNGNNGGVTATRSCVLCPK